MLALRARPSISQLQLFRNKDVVLSCMSTLPYMKNSLLRSLKREAPIDIHPEVQHALHRHKPVVALETAIVTNGMPAPTNLEIGRKLESIVRKEGAVPATIGIVEGRVKIGLEDAQLQRLADKTRTGDDSPVKVSRRDIGAVLALRRDGGTTICSTLIFAALAGIKVIATGGLGGVHRGGETTMDVSADLQELARCPVAVVSCGVKSILDIGRTLEYLETMGVPVVTYGTTYDFPAFYSGKSGFKSIWKVNDPRTAASMLVSQWQLGLENGTLFAAPIPNEYMSQGAEIQSAIEQAIAESEQNGVSKNGRDVTPWLLNRVMELTGGKSLQSNVALIENTAAIGSRIAVEYANLQHALHGRSGHLQPFVLSTNTNEDQPQKPKSYEETPRIMKEKARLVVIGASAVDISSTLQGTQEVSESGVVDLGRSTVPGSVSLTMGGVARNIAEAAHRLFTARSSLHAGATLLVSPIGQDEFSPLLVAEQKRLGMRTDGLLRTSNGRTAVCNMLLDGAGSLIGGVADMDIVRNVVHSKITDLLANETDDLRLVALDANLGPAAISTVVDHCVSTKTEVLFEPTSVSKSTAILDSIRTPVSKNAEALINGSLIAYCTPNIIELKEIYEAASSDSYSLTDTPAWWKTIDKFGLGSQWRTDLLQLSNVPAGPGKDKGTLSFLVKDGIAQMAVNLLPFFQNIIVKCGDRGVVAAVRVSGEEAVRNSVWSKERSNPSKRYIIAQGADGKELVALQHYPAIEVKKEEVVNVTGAGDSLVGALCAGIAMDRTTFHDPAKLDALILLAQEAAVLSLHSVRAISPLLGNASSHSRFRSSA